MFRILEINIKTALIIVLYVVLISCPVFGQQENSAPVFQTVSKQYVLEGEELNLSISAEDPDGDDITIAAISRPVGAAFVDHGNGSADFGWTSDFTGPGSSDGSPLELRLVASDGEKSSSIAVEIIVINNNRCPYIVSPDTVSVQSGSELDFEIYGYDPDFDLTGWKMIAKPEELEFIAGNPGLAGWQTAFADSGYHSALFELSDSYGAADTAEVIMNVLPTAVYELSIDTLSAYSSEVVEVSINLMNLEPVSAFNLLVHFDPSVLTFIEITRMGTRTEDWEFFNYNLNEAGLAGDIRITGIADMDNEVITDDLAAGDGVVAKLTMYVSHDLNYAGYAIPVVFAFRDIFQGNDNTMTSPVGEQITQEMIGYSNGYVTIKTISEDNIGDINMNGVAFEIGDAIYYTNHFIDPIYFPFSPVQLLNSDVNRDGYGSTIADLVYLIKTLLDFQLKNGKVRFIDEKVNIIAGNNGAHFRLGYDSEIELGGMVVTLETDKVLTGDIKLISSMEKSGMSLKSSVDGNLIRLIIYSEEGLAMPSGVNDFFTFESNIDFKIKEIQLSSTDGLMVEPVLKDNLSGLLPQKFILHQNYPNPFNPTTEIRYELPQASNIGLTIYNILGQEVIRLVDGINSAGAHSVVWDGCDSYGSTVASGIYFYRLQSDEFSDQKKMILLK